MTESPHLDLASIRFDLTVPCDARFRPMLDQLASRLIAYVGYAASDATTLTRAVERTTERVLTGAAGRPYAALDVSFRTSETEMEIRIRCRQGPDGPRDGEGTEIERMLSQAGEDDTPLDFIQRVMTRVEFDREDGADICTLVRTLPDAS